MGGFTAAERRKVIILIQEECCNHIAGDCVPCDVKCAQIASMRQGSDNPDLVCRWFRDAVLPLDKDLLGVLLAPHNMKKCEWCGNIFSPSNNRAKYCEPCAIKDRQKRQREYVQKKRGILSTVRA